MNEVGDLKAAPWRRLAQELGTCPPDDGAFARRLLDVLAQSAGARQAALVRAGEGDEDVRVLLVWSGGSVRGAGEQALEHPQPVRAAARGALATQQSRVLALGPGGGDLLYDPGAGSGYVVALPLPEDGPPLAVTLLVDARSRGALQTTVAAGELIVGYVRGHAARRDLARAQDTSRALDLATRLLASINQAPGFKGAALALCNDLARSLGAERVSLGWLRGADVRPARPGAPRTRGETSVHVLAISDTEHIDQRLALVVKLRAAMEECVDQDQPVVYPLGEGDAGPPPGVRPPEPPGPPAPADVATQVLAQAVAHAHRQLVLGDARLRAMSLPLRSGDDVLGAVTIESVRPLGPGDAELAQAVLDLVAPVLAVRRSDDRWLPRRALDASLRSASWLVGPRHTAWKLAGLLVAAAGLSLVLVRAPYRVEAPGSLSPREQRVIAAPFDGIVRAVGASAQPGQAVDAGDELLRLDDSELRLSALEARGAVEQADKQADASLKAGKPSEAQQARAQGDQARARLSLLEGRIERSRIVAPIAGTVIEGDLSDRVGSAVRVGEELLRVADLSGMVVIAQVSDADIALVGPGSTGSVATRAYPGRHFPIVVERVVPLARAGEGRNAFEVRARLEGSAGWLRPGMECVVRFDAGRRTLLHIGTRRVVDTLRLWLWW